MQRKVAMPASRFYERSVLEIVGRWISIYGESVYDTKTVSEVKCQGRDLLLQNGNTFYYFVFGLGIHGNANVTVNIAGIGSRAVDGFSRKIVFRMRGFRPALQGRYPAGDSLRSRGCDREVR